MKKIILSDNKLNLLVDEVTEALLAQKAISTSGITGDEIAQFCTHDQVNQFVRFRIYQDANTFVAQLNHTYFDFNTTEVKDELRRLLASLSRNILISPADFKLLLRQAVYNTLRLILSPEDTILGFFFGGADAIPLELYRKHAVYFSDYDFVIRSILAWYEKQNLTRVEKTVFQEKMDRVVELFEKKEGRTAGEYQRGLFRALTGKDLDNVLGVASPAVEEKKQEPQQEPKVEEQKKPLISVRPKEREQPPVETKTETPPVNREPKTTLPPWVEQKTPPPVEEPKKPSPFSVNSAPPRSETPPWVEKKQPPVQREGIIDPVTPLPDEDEPKTQQPKVETPRQETPKVVETPRVAETPKVETPEPKEEKRSLNQMFSNKDKERPTILSQQEKSGEDKGSILDRFQQDKKTTTPPTVETPRVEPPKVVETPKSEPEQREMPTFEFPKAEPLANPSPVEEIKRPTIQTPPPADREPETKTLADRFKENTQSGSLADNLAAKSIRTEQIPVHKQFQFVQKVFGGSSVKFKVILDKINKTTTLPEAEEVLEKYVFNDPNVNRNDKVAKEFEQLVRARFE